MEQYQYYESRKGGTVGIQNNGNSCYAASCLQLLFACPHFSKFMTGDGRLKDEIGKATASVMARMSSSSEPIDVEDFLGVVAKHWGEWTFPNEQQDVFSFLCFLLGALHEDVMVSVGMNKPAFEDIYPLNDEVLLAWDRSSKSPVNSLFGVQLITLSLCRKKGCFYESLNCSTQQSVSLDIPVQCQTNDTTLEAILGNMTSEIVPDFTRCELCKSEGTLSVKRLFGHLPPYLIFHLKRFEMTNVKGTLMYRKKEGFISFQTVLDLQEHCVEDVSNSTRYELLGVINHSSGGAGVLERGHYTTFFKKDERWYECNDSIVSNTTLRKVVTRNAYIILYKLSSYNFEEFSKFSLSIPHKSTQECVEPPPKTPQDPKRNVEPPPVHLDSSGGGVDINTSCAFTTAVTSTPLIEEPVSKPPHNAPDIQYHAPTPCGRQLTVKRPKWDLDILDPVLTEEDIPFKVLDLADKKSWSVAAMQDWLKSRGLRQKGKREELVLRVTNHMKMGKTDRIDPKVDGGAWHRRKKEALQNKVQDMDRIPTLPTGIKVWNPFPSTRIPAFTDQKMIDYYQNMPDVRYSHQEGVIALKELQLEDVDYEEVEEIDVIENAPSDDFAALCRRAVMKCIDRGHRYLRSGFVITVLDTARGDFYFIKAQIHASMKQELHLSTVTIWLASGEVCAASCDCKAQALQRCGHIAALMLLVLKHITIHGNEAVTATGRPCYWREKAPGKDPGFICDKTNYSRRQAYKKRMTFDPRPTKLQLDRISEDQIKKFQKTLEEKYPSSLWNMHLRDPPEATENVDSSEIDLLDDLEKIVVKCSQKIWEMHQIRKEVGDRPYELGYTIGQRNNGQWLKDRAWHACASSSKTLIGLHKESTIINWLRQHVWMINRRVTQAMQYGIDHEDEAKESYISKIKASHPAATVRECGIWKHPKFPTLSCSPDGLVQLSPNTQFILLEIKCLTKTHVNPSTFEEGMTSNQISSFYLKRLSNGALSMKETHQYYYQIQMSLDILEIDKAHLFVWSESGSVIVEVARDESFWFEKRQRIIARHRSLILPEHFLKRALNNMPAIEVHYSPFHEDENDNYFANLADENANYISDS